MVHRQAAGFGDRESPARARTWYERWDALFRQARDRELTNLVAVIRQDPAAAEQQRRSVVEPAKRSPAAFTKTGRKRTDDQLPVHSFRTVPADLGTLTSNTTQVTEGGATFKQQTQRTPMQQRCLEFLGVTPRL